MNEERCVLSNRADGKHSWKFDGDDPYVICVYCDEMRDALTERVVRKGRSIDELHNQNILPRRGESKL